MVQVPEHLRARVDALVAQRRRALLDKVAATEREIRGLQDRRQALFADLAVLRAAGPVVETRSRPDGPRSPADPALPEAARRAVAEAHVRLLAALDAEEAEEARKDAAAREGLDEAGRARLDRLCERGARGWQGRREALLGFRRAWEHRLTCEREELAARVLAGLPDRPDPMAHARLDKLVRRLRGDLDRARAELGGLGPVRWSQVDGAGRLLWLSVASALGRWTADRVFGPSAAWYSWPVALRMREVADPIDPDALLGVLLAGGPAGPDLPAESAEPRARAVLAWVEPPLVAGLRVLSQALRRDPSGAWGHLSRAQADLDEVLAGAHARCGEPGPILELGLEVGAADPRGATISTVLAVRCAPGPGQDALRRTLLAELAARLTPALNGGAG